MQFEVWGWGGGAGSDWLPCTRPAVITVPSIGALALLLRSSQSTQTGSAERNTALEESHSIIHTHTNPHRAGRLPNAPVEDQDGNTDVEAQTFQN